MKRFLKAEKLKIGNLVLKDGLQYSDYLKMVEVLVKSKKKDHIILHVK